MHSTNLHSVIYPGTKVVRGQHSVNAHLAQVISFIYMLRESREATGIS